MRWKIDRTHESFFLDWRHGNRCPGACSGIALATLAFGDDLDDPPCPYLARKDVPPSLALKYDCTAKSLHETRDACMTTPFPPAFALETLRCFPLPPPIRQTMPLHFPDVKMTTFLRQLKFYGFKKVRYRILWGGSNPAPWRQCSLPATVLRLVPIPATWT